jgi:hypothetical protein
MKETARRDARFYRARAERCYRLARQYPDLLGVEIVLATVGSGLTEMAEKIERGSEPAGTCEKTTRAQQRRGRKARENGVGWPK